MHPGEKIEFVLRPTAKSGGGANATGVRGEQYAVAEYVKLLMRAAREVIEPVCGERKFNSLLLTGMALDRRLL